MIVGTVDGNVGSDPELRYTQGGKAVCNFSLGSSTKVGNERQTTWVDVTCWEECAEVVAEQVRKGMRVIVTGRLLVEEFSRKDGSKGQKLKMVADDVGASMRFKPRGAAPAKAVAGGAVSGPEEGGDDDSIPF